MIPIAMIPIIMFPIIMITIIMIPIIMNSSDYERFVPIIMIPIRMIIMILNIMIMSVIIMSMVSMIMLIMIMMFWMAECNYKYMYIYEVVVPICSMKYMYVLAHGIYRSDAIRYVLHRTFVAFSYYMNCAFFAKRRAYALDSLRHKYKKQHCLFCV